jgi:hypothetical protein
MRNLLFTLIYIIKDWDLSMDEFKPMGKILFWIPNFLNNVLVVLFKTVFFPIIYLWFLFYNTHKRLVLRFYVYWKQSLILIK